MLLYVCVCLMSPVAVNDSVQIALYESIGKTSGSVSHTWVIHNEGLIIEVIRGESKPDTTDTPQFVVKACGVLSSFEHRTIYHLNTQEITSFSVFGDYTILYYDPDSFRHHMNEYSVVHRETPGDTIRYDIVSDSVLHYSLFLAGNIPNFHHSRLFFPQVKTLPVKIETGRIVTTLKKIVTDQDEKDAILKSLQLDLENYRVVDQEDVGKMTQEMFGMSLEQMGVWIKAMAQSYKKN